MNSFAPCGVCGHEASLHCADVVGGACLYDYCSCLIFVGKGEARKPPKNGGWEQMYSKYLGTGHDEKLPSSASIHLNSIPINGGVIFKTTTQWFTLRRTTEEHWLLSGHPTHCTVPVPVVFPSGAVLTNKFNLSVNLAADGKPFSEPIKAIQRVLPEEWALEEAPISMKDSLR